MELRPPAAQNLRDPQQLLWRTKRQSPTDGYGTDDFIKDARMSIQESHQVRTLSEVHDSVADLEPREIGDRGDEVADETRKTV